MSAETPAARPGRKEHEAWEVRVPVKVIRCRSRRDACRRALVPLLGLLLFVLEELILETIDQGQPARLNDVLADADGAPDRVLVAPLDDHAHAHHRLRSRVHHPYL